MGGGGPFHALFAFHFQYPVTVNCSFSSRMRYFHFLARRFPPATIPVTNFNLDNSMRVRKLHLNISSYKLITKAHFTFFSFQDVDCNLFLLNSKFSRKFLKLIFYVI